MHGNVREWCEDHWRRNYTGAPRMVRPGTRLMMRCCVSFAVAPGTAAHRSCVRHSAKDMP
ncbi:MAG TPA: hypothetical protein VK148_31730, partial [Xanthobacteraceae bacterium]|nr:hypothetical protein [Xanthobacteraceae bacterium]